MWFYVPEDRPNYPGAFAGLWWSLFYAHQNVSQFSRCFTPVNLYQLKCFGRTMANVIRRGNDGIKIARCSIQLHRNHKRPEIVHIFGSSLNSAANISRNGFWQMI